jgi:ribonuclease P protein component
VPADYRPGEPPRESLPASAKLRRRSEYQAIQQHGRRFPTQDLIILWQEGRSRCTRLGVTVSKRVAKQAVRRNRIKRWIREAFRRLPGRSTRPVIDMVVIARGGAPRSAFADLQRQLHTFWLKAPRQSNHRPSDA